MREMGLYRGKRVDTGEWVYGSLMTLFYPTNRLCITCPGSNQHWSNTQFIEVIPETVGEYTGLKDKNGVNIFEGDICSCHNYGNQSFEIIWNDERLMFGFYYESTWGKSFVGISHLKYDTEVIGNIYENPELLENK